jgi:DNA polymerase-3 subunit delta
MLVREAMKAIKQKSFAPVYILYGTETYLMEEFLAFARSHLVHPDVADFVYSQYDCEETPLAAILEDAETLPFMSDQRMVVARQAFFLTGAKPPSKVEVNLDLLQQYLLQPPGYTSLFFVVETEKLDERKKVVKLAREKAVVLSFQPLKEADLYGFVEQRARYWGAKMDRPTAIRLVETVGEDLRLLDKELEKMALFVGTNGEITERVVSLLACRTLENNVFEMVEAAINGNLAEAVRILKDCLKTGEEPIRLLSLLARQFRILLHVKMWAPRGYTQQQLAGMLKLHPYAVKLAMEQARHFDEHSLRYILGLLAEEDYRLKTGQTDRRIALELILTRIVQAREGRLIRQ